MDLKSLQAQLDSTEKEMELAKAHVHRCDGAIQILKHLIKDLEDNGALDHSDVPKADPVKD